MIPSSYHILKFLNSCNILHHNEVVKGFAHHLYLRPWALASGTEKQTEAPCGLPDVTQLEDSRVHNKPSF